MEFHVALKMRSLLFIRYQLGANYIIDYTFEVQTGYVI